MSFLQNLLLHWGFEVFTAENSSDASEVMRQTSPSPRILITDISTNAIDFCARLRAGSDYYAYILMTAATACSEDRQLALFSGADDYLPEPFDALELLARLCVATRVVNLQDGLLHELEQLRVRATKDSLTGLYNRAAFLDLFQRELDRAARSKSRVGFLLVDLDHFNSINDGYGLSGGDEALAEVAGRLKRAVRSYDVIGRFGGDKFSLVLPNCFEKDVRERAEAIRTSIWGEPISFGPASVRVSVSIGATVAYPNGWSTADTIAVADVAVCRAKNSGRNCAVFCRRRISSESLAEEDLKRLCATCDPRSSKKCLVSSHSTEIH